MNQFFKQEEKRPTLEDRGDDAAWEGRWEAICKEADAILEREGVFHVNGIYFVLESDATTARMVAAEQIVARRDASMDRYISTPRARAAS